MRRRRAVVVVCLIGAVLAAGGTPAGAAVLVSDTPVAAWRVDGVTRAVAVVGDTTYVGGSFTRATAPDGTSRPRANLAAFHTRTGALVEGFRADTNGIVRALASDGATLWVGGSYTTIGGQQRARVAALDPSTGAVRTSFRADANSNVYALDQRAGRLFVAGSFSSIGGLARGRAAAVDPATGAVDRQWSPAANNTVLAIRSNPAGSVVYLSGSFSTVGGSARAGLAAVSGTTGAPVAPVFADSYVGTIDLDLEPDGSRLYVAAAGAGNQAAAYSTSTGRRLWRQRADGDVQTVAVHRGTVYFGFHESFGGDTSVRLLAADAATGALDPTFRPSFDRYWGLHDLAVTDAVVAGAGDFTRVGGVAAQGLVLFPADREPPAPPPTVVSYLDAASTWRYHDQGTDPGPGWRSPGFDDSAFPSGTPEFGYGDGDETTVVSFGPSSSNKHLVTWFRTTFEAGSTPSALTVSLVADDGAVVHLNGVEVVRDNVPAGPVTSTTRAATARSGSAEYQVRRFSVDPGLLVAGTNTVTASVHQDSSGSSDLSFDLQLHGEVASSPPPTTTTTAPPTTTTTAPPTTTTTTAPPPTTTTTAPPTASTVLASWSSGADAFDTVTGTRATVETGGSHGERLRWAQAPDQVAYASWTAARLGAPAPEHALRWVGTFSGFPSAAFSLAQGLQESGGLTQRWRLELTPAGRVRIRDEANRTTGESDGQPVPLGTEVRFEAVRRGTTMTVEAFSPVGSTTPLLRVSGSVGSDVNHVRIGAVTRTPTAPAFTADEVVLAAGADPVGPPK